MINNWTITKAIKSLKEKKCSVSELVEACIKVAEKHKHLNVFITETFDVARKQAKASEIKYLNGEERLLEGIPLAIKDVFCTNGIKTTNASKILDNFVPQYESTVTSKLFDQGGVMIGKANLDEFAMGSANTNSAFGPVISPWKANDSDKDLVPGGSSGGSAAAVAARMAFASLGTDTGGSVRLPGAYSGIIGFKPTYGRCSRYGIIGFASSLDQAGIFTRSVDDLALMASVVMGHDDKDSTSENRPLPDFTPSLHKSVKGMKIGIPKEYHAHGLDPEIEKLWMDAKDILQREGAEIVDVTLPHTKYGVAAYYVIAPAEASSNLARYDGVKYGLRVLEDGMKLEDMYEATRSEGFGKEVKRRIMIGTYVLSAGFKGDYFLQAQKVRRLMALDFKHAFEKVDALITPVTTNTAFALDDKASLDPISLYLNDAFTIPASMAGLPAMSVPGRLNARGLPIGVQIIANKFMEAPLLRVAKTLERCFNFDKVPEGY